MEKLAHLVTFLLLASLFQPFTAQNLDTDVLQLGVSQSHCPGVTKARWPELIGVPAKLARETIQKENSRLTDIPSILNGSPVPLDFRCDRVRLFVNVLDFVVQIPHVT